MTLTETIEHAEKMGQLDIDSEAGKVALQTKQGTFTRTYGHNVYRAIWNVIFDAEDAQKQTRTIQVEVCSFERKGKEMEISVKNLIAQIESKIAECSLVAHPKKIDDKSYYLGVSQALSTILPYLRTLDAQKPE